MRAGLLCHFLLPAVVCSPSIICIQRVPGNRNHFRSVREVPFEQFAILVVEVSVNGKVGSNYASFAGFALAPIFPVGLTCLAYI